MKENQQNTAAGQKSAPGGTPILRVEHLGMSFRGVDAIKDLSFEVEAGEIFGIAGPNGAGKTTLFNVISGIYSGSGKIVFKSTDISRAKPHRVCHLGITRTLQTPNIFGTLNVYDNVRFGAYFGKRGRTREKELIQRFIEFVGLSKHAYFQARSLGLFRKKLVMIAAALATRPAILLLDEPVGGLSPAEIEPLIKLIHRINKELKITVIIIEHLMKVLKALSNRMMIIHYGQNISIGRPEDVMANEKVKAVYLG